VAKFTFAPEPKLPFLAVIVRSTFWREDLLHADIVNQMRAPDDRSRCAGCATARRRG